jgi:hypothetical protein
MLLGDQRKKAVNKKLLTIALMTSIPTIGVMLSFILMDNIEANIIIFVVYFFISNGFGFALIKIIKNERVKLKDKKVKVISLDYVVDFDFENYNPKKQFLPNDFFKGNQENGEFVPILNVVDENETYKIVIIFNYYIAVIEDQYNQRYLIHTNNLNIIE